MTTDRPQFSEPELAAILADAAYRLHMLQARPRGAPAQLRPADQGLELIDRCRCHGAWSWQGRCRVGSVR